MTRIDRPGPALAFVAVLGLLTFGVAMAYGAVQDRERTYRYFAEAMESPAEPQAQIRWEDPVRPLTRPFEAADAARVGRAMTEAWQALATALHSGDGRALADQFAGVALARAETATAEARADGAGMVVLRSTARPAFYHRDGSLLQVEADAMTARFAVTGPDLAFFDVTMDRTLTTLTNETTGWRVFSHERQDARALAAPKAAPFAGRIAGINYYPAGTPWRAFWDGYDPAVIAADFDRIRGLGANAVRVFLPREDFLDPARRSVNLPRLADLLKQAAARGLQVVPTLFDLRGSYAPGTWSEDAVYLGAVLPVLAADPSAIAFIDLKNEPDLDFEREGRGVVLAWALSMIEVIRADAPGLRVTIGWSSVGAATALAERLDLITYHDYAPMQGSAARLDALRREFPGIPVVVTEIGASSFGLAFGLPSSPDKQARALEDRILSLAAAEGMMVWTLHDFPNPDPAAVGRSPWRRGIQSAFGLIAPDGTEKPAAATVRAAFTDYLNGAN